jgi:ribosome-associated toxin RatA of RatAB toxin-antitoxin module
VSPEIVTTNTRVIASDPETVFSLAADVSAWPAILPHYRYVRVLSSDEATRTVAMGASRSGIPVRWTAVQQLYPQSLEIRYRHVAGVTRGMEVLWKIEPAEAGSRAVITHRLHPRQWWLQTGATRWMVGTVFVMNIADRTLAGIASRAERGMR